MACKADLTCGNVINTSNGEILNALYAEAYKSTEDTAMTNEEWTAAHAAAEQLTELSKKPNSDSWFEKIDEYYNVLLNDKLNEAEEFLEEKGRELREMFKEREIAESDAASEQASSASSSESSTSTSSDTSTSSSSTSSSSSSSSSSDSSAGSSSSSSDSSAGGPSSGGSGGGGGPGGRRLQPGGKSGGPGGGGGGPD